MTDVVDRTVVGVEPAIEMDNHLHHLHHRRLIDVGDHIVAAAAMGNHRIVTDVVDHIVVGEQVVERNLMIDLETVLHMIVMVERNFVVVMGHHKIETAGQNFVAAMERRTIEMVDLVGVLAIEVDRSFVMVDLVLVMELRMNLMVCLGMHLVAANRSYRMVEEYSLSHLENCYRHHLKRFVNKLDYTTVIKL